MMFIDMTRMISTDLSASEYSPYYQPYIDRVGAGDVLEILKVNCEAIDAFMRTIPDDRLSFQYAEGKWTIKQILLHMIDTERVMCYRALCIARMDQIELLGFDHDAYVDSSHAKKRSMKSLLNEYKAVRSATVALYASFNEQAWLRKGKASGSSVSVRALAFIIAGHEKHHVELIRSLYL